MKNEFILAFNEVLEDKQLPKDVILQALEAAMISAYRRAVNASSAQEVHAKIDSETGKVSIYAEKEVVEAVQDTRTEVSLAEACTINPNTQLGEMVIVESTPHDFGRVAAQTARQVIQQRIREAERDSQLSYYSKQMGEIVNGVVQAVAPTGITLGLDMKAEGIMPRNQMIPGERFRVHDRVRALLLEVKQSPRGPQIILSRAHRNFLRRLLENEVPEIYHGLVEIRSISREPGQRSKVAVVALQPGVDPVGACVGLRGVRIQAIVRELNDEKIDVIEWNPDPAGYIAKALSPARVTGVYLNEQTKGAKTATVVVPEDQLSLAIGRDGQNARLAAKLTSWKIDIKSLPEAATDALYKLQNLAEYAFLLENERETIPLVEAVLAKKAEGRPVTPEEYQTLSHFVDRIERGLIRQRQAEIQAKEEHERAVRSLVPEVAFSMLLETMGLPERLYNLLTEAGYQTVGDLRYQILTNPDSILGLSGVGPRTMQEIENAYTTLNLPEPAQPEVAEAALVEAEKVEAEAVEVPVAVEAVETAEPTFVLPAQPVSVDVSVPAEAAPVVAEDVVPVGEETLAISAEQAGVVEIEKPAVVEQAEPVGLAREPQPITIEGELPESFDELFTLKPEVFQVSESYDEEEENEDEDKTRRKKGKKKKKKYTEIEYDPDADMMVVKKKRKRGDQDWGDEWEV